MAINKTMMAVLKALSYPDLGVKRTYQLERQAQDLADRLRQKPALYNSWDREIPCGDHNVPVRIFSPSVGDYHHMLLFFHGGGWVVGSIDSYDTVCTYMAQLTDCVVVSVDYRLAPEFPFPAGLEDCYAAAREIFMNLGPQGQLPDDITLIGDSAGGNLAAAVSLLAGQRGEFMPRRQILIYPATNNDHSEDSPFPSVRENGTDYLLTSRRVRDFMELYRGAPEDTENPLYAPLLASAEDLAGQPKTLIVTAEYDPLRDEGEAYGHRLHDAGVPTQIYRMEDALHGFMSLPPQWPHVTKLYEIIGRFLRDEVV